MWKAERLLSADGQPTRWMAEEGGFFVMHLGCQKIVKGFRIDNSQHKNKEGNKKDSFAFEILVRHAVAVLLQCCCYAVAIQLLIVKPNQAGARVILVKILLRLLQGFAKVVIYIFCPLPNKNSTTFIFLV